MRARKLKCRDNTLVIPSTDSLLSFPQQTARYSPLNRQPAVITSSIDACYHSFDRLPVITPSTDCLLSLLRQTACYHSVNRLPVITPSTDCLLSLPQQTACYHSLNRHLLLLPQVFHFLQKAASCKKTTRGGKFEQPRLCTMEVARRASRVQK